MKYEIIWSEDEINKFLDLLPELSDNETYYLSLFSRKKYSPGLIFSNDRTLLKRFTSKKKDIIKKIKQLEIDYGLYDLNGRIVPNESLVMYIHPNPRCQIRSAKLLTKDLIDIVFNGNQGYNVVEVALNALQKSKSYTHLIDFDLDVDKNTFNINEIFKYVNQDATHIVETRGGYHLLVNHLKINPKLLKSFYSNLSKLAEQTGDIMIPIPGTIQGEWNVKLIN